MKHETVVDVEGTWKEFFAAEGKLATLHDKTRGRVELGDPVVIISQETTDGSKYGSRNVLRPMSPLAARAFAEQLVLAAEEAERLYNEQRSG